MKGYKRNHTAHQRFLSYVSTLPHPQGCWVWKGPLADRGYGEFKYLGTRIRASRYSLMLRVGPMSATTYACHKCDNPGCVNPDHLFPGSAGDNYADSRAKGRVPLGESHYAAKMTAENVVELRKLRADGWGYKRLGKKYGVSKVAARNAYLGRTWKCVA